MTNKIEHIGDFILKVEIGIPETGDKTETIGGIKDVQPLFLSDKSTIFKFEFRNFVSYSITEEMFVKNSEYDVFEGAWVRLYSNSHFKDFVQKTTWASDEYPGELHHFQINSYSHRIDVVTSFLPQVTT